MFYSNSSCSQLPQTAKVHLTVYDGEILRDLDYQLGLASKVGHVLLGQGRNEDGYVEELGDGLDESETTRLEMQNKD